MLTGLSLHPQRVACYPCLDDLHATESGDKGAVVALALLHDYRYHINSWNGHRTSTHNWNKLNTLLSSLVQWYTCTHGRRNNVFRGGPNISQLFWNIRSRGNVFYESPNLTWHTLIIATSLDQASLWEGGWEWDHDIVYSLSICVTISKIRWIAHILLC